MKKAMATVAGIMVTLALAACGQQPQAIECAMCGAHVHDWWYAQGKDGHPVEVCEVCYQDVRGEM